QTQFNNDIYAVGLEIALPNGKVLGTLGIVSHKILAKFDIEQEVYFAELNWNLLMKEAAKAKIAAGDILKSINGNLINDVLDYRFYITDSVVALCFLHNEHEENCIIKKSEYSDIGLEFDGYLMDAKKSCRNKCIFCFIDQNPKGMRESIYFKDDDERLSFLQGNYVTLTNLNESDIQRIIKMKISPINVSVHTTNPDLRIKMTNNRFAGESLRFLKMLSDANIELNLQFVLCKGINDGDELISSLEYIKKLKSVASAAVVPCGLTGYRDGLFKLEPFDKKSACAVVETVEKFNAEYRKTSGSGVVFASDEFYLISQKDLPNDEYYDGYLQLENGIGMITNLKTEFFDELKYTDSALPGKISIATGEAAYLHIKELATAFTLKFP
ncbi:MAG: DUF512 domain-containing protein, partial [Clostridia bacterium]